MIVTDECLTQIILVTIVEINDQLICLSHIPLSRLKKKKKTIVANIYWPNKFVFV